MAKLERKEKIAALESTINAPAPTLSEDEQKEEDRKEVNRLVEQADITKHAKAVASIKRKIAKDKTDDTLKVDLKKAEALVAKDDEGAKIREADAKAEPKPEPEKDAARAELSKLKAA